MKWFISSDIHGFYDEWMTALNKAGFEKDNPEHGILVCGDIFDRGSKPLEVYTFLRELPKERRILVRGNHEELLQQLVDRGYPESYDEHNGTYTTLFDLIGVDRDEFIKKERAKHRRILDKYSYGTPEFNEAETKARETRRKFEHRLFHNKKLTEILKWIASDEWVNYYEIGKYIFVHAFIPLQDAPRETTDDFLSYYMFGGNQEYCPNWRTLPTYSWSEAWWCCPWKMFKQGYFNEESKAGKILVCGHWHSSDFWNILEDKGYDTYTTNPIFISERYPNLIALDTCTAATGGVNVMVLDDVTMNLTIYNHNEE